MKDNFLQHLEKHVSYTVLDERYFDVLTQVDRLVKKGNPAVIAIDGRCGSGKTSLANLIDIFLQYSPYGRLLPAD